MHHRYLILTGTLALLLVIGGWFVLRGGTEIVNYPSNGKNVIAFGNSLIEGVGASNGSDFISILSEEIGVPIINVGVSGDTTKDGLTRLGADVLSQDPKIVIISLGGNDYLKRLPKNETFENLESMIVQIQEEGAIVLLLGVRGGLLRDSYENEYRDVAEKMGAAYVPNILDDIIGVPGLMYDPIHPNDTGHRIIAEKILPVLQELI